MAAPTMIPVKANRNQYSGPLSIMNNVAPRSAEIDALFPIRQGRERQYTFQPPEYFELMRDAQNKVILGDDGKPRTITHYMVWCPACAEWQRREAFYADVSRTNGLRGYCKTCENEKRVQRRRRAA